MPQWKTCSCAWTSRQHTQCGASQSCIGFSTVLCATFRAEQGHSYPWHLSWSKSLRLLGHWHTSARGKVQEVLDYQSDCFKTQMARLRYHAPLRCSKTLFLGFLKSDRANLTRFQICLFASWKCLVVTMVHHQYRRTIQVRCHHLSALKSHFEL